MWNLQAFPSQLKRAFPRELATTLAATCLSHLFSRAFKTLPQAFPRQQLSQHMPQPCVSKGVQGCRLPALKPLNPPAGLSKPTTFAATCPSQVFFSAFEAAIGLSKATTLAAHASAMRFERRSRLPFARFETFKPSRRPVQGNHFRSYMPQPGVFYGVRSHDAKIPRCVSEVHFGHFLTIFCCFFGARQARKYCHLQ